MDGPAAAQRLTPLGALDPLIPRSTGAFVSVGGIALVGISFDPL